MLLRPPNGGDNVGQAPRGKQRRQLLTAPQMPPASDVATAASQDGAPRLCCKPGPATLIGCFEPVSLALQLPSRVGPGAAFPADGPPQVARGEALTGGSGQPTGSGGALELPPAAAGSLLVLREASVPTEEEAAAGTRSGARLRVAASTSPPNPGRRSSAALI